MLSLSTGQRALLYSACATITVITRKKFPCGVSANNFLFADTLSANNFLFADRYLQISFYLQIGYLQITSSFDKCIAQISQLQCNSMQSLLCLKISYKVQQLSQCTRTHTLNSFLLEATLTIFVHPFDPHISGAEPTFRNWSKCCSMCLFLHVLDSYVVCQKSLFVNQSHTSAASTPLKDWESNLLPIQTCLCIRNCKTFFFQINDKFL